MSEFTLIDPSLLSSRTLLDDADETLDSEEMDALFNTLEGAGWSEDEIVRLAARFD